MKLKQKISLISFFIVFLANATACADNDKTRQAAIVSPPTAVKAAGQATDPIAAEDVQRFGTALEIIKRYYVEEVPNQKLFDNALRGLLSGLDPHSSYLDETELKD